MKKIIFALLLASTAQAQTGENAQGLMSGERYLELYDQFPRLIESYSAGVYHTALTLPGMTCPPADLSAAEATQVALKMLKSRPDLQKHQVVQLLLSAWQYTWPCEAPGQSQKAPTQSAPAKP